MKKESVTINGMPAELRNVVRSKCIREGIKITRGCEIAVTNLLVILDTKKITFEASSPNPRPWNVRISRELMASIRKKCHAMNVRQSPFIAAALKIWASDDCDNR